MAALVLHNPALHFVTDPDNAAVSTNLSEFTKAVIITSTADSIDIGTFQTPSASAVGRVQNDSTIDFYWSKELPETLEPLLGEDLEIQLFPDGEPDTSIAHNMISYRGSFAALPWGTFALGAPVDSTLTMGVATAPKSETVPPL